MYNPNEIYQKLIEAGTDWADKKAAYELLNELTKTILASLKKQSHGSSDAERTTDALAHEDYKIHLAETAGARKAFLLAQVKYHSMQALADARRTEASTRRVEAQYVSMQDG
jgi:hypothetical protein